MHEPQGSLGSHFSDHDKLGMTELELTSAHELLDTKHLTQVNWALTGMMHDTLFSGVTESADITKLRGILKTPQLSKILEVGKMGTESTWSAQPWLMPAMQVWANLVYKFKGMTDMINGCSMDDLAELLTASTGDQRKSKTMYEIDFGVREDVQHVAQELRQSEIAQRARGGVWGRSGEVSGRARGGVFRDFGSSRSLHS